MKIALQFCFKIILKLSHSSQFCSLDFVTENLICKLSTTWDSFESHGFVINYYKLISRVLLNMFLLEHFNSV